MSARELHFAQVLSMGLMALACSKVETKRDNVEEPTPGAAAAPGPSAGDKDCCMGKNDCKGKGGCAVPESNACMGKNDCKGKGGCNMHCPK